MTHDDAVRFAAEWVEAWNRHDIEAVLTHYADDFEMTTPMIQQVLGIASGTLQGKKAVGDYWRAALQKVPNLEFSILEVTSGVDVVSIYYRAVLGKTAIETFYFDKTGLITKAIATYH
jgi:ketosteroid isomerase-like protein